MTAPKKTESPAGWKALQARYPHLQHYRKPEQWLAEVREVHGDRFLLDNAEPVSLCRAIVEGLSASEVSQ